MADGTKIEWAEATWNPITGCSLASPGCTNCYAMQLAGTRLKHSPSRKRLTQPSKAGPVWTGEVRFNEHELTKPLRWGRPRMIFVCAHGDLYHESVPDVWIDRIFAVMALCPQHTFQVLTKRSARMREYLINPDRAVKIAYRVNAWGDGVGRDAKVRRAAHNTVGGSWPLPNVWLGVSVEDQQRADERIPDLLATPAAVRWISAEPLLGAVDLTKIELRPFGGRMTELSNKLGDYVLPLRGALRGSPTIGWVVVGGESGSKARPMHPDWARSVRDQCAAAGVPFFFKQWGEWLSIDDWYEDHPVSLPLRTWSDGRWTDRPELVMPDAAWLARIGKKPAGRLLDGVEHNGMPEQIASGANCSEVPHG